MKQEIKKRIYFNEYNFLMGQTTYLPLVSGLLQAYAEKTPDLRNHYDFMPFLFHVDLPEKIISQIDNPFIATFSVMMWNEQLSLQVAKEIKDKFPNCIIIFGGAQPPHRPIDYFKKYPFIDITVRGQGEETFSKILTALVDKSDLREIPSMSWRDPVSGECIVNEEELIFNNDLDRFPSPYLKGLYDDLIKSRKDLNFQAILETNRGCPFMCTFCYWGMGGLNRKFSFHSIERIKQEFEWCGKNGIVYIFNADSNFGQHDRDMEIVDALIKTKEKFGYPEKFRTCYGKNTDEKIYEIARKMFENKLEKGITLSRQSNDREVLKIIKRGNIKMSTYVNLQKKFNEADIPVYSELILGLPGETYNSWKQGIEDLLQAGLKNQLFIYLCQVFPNTELADEGYREQHGILTKRIELNELHGSFRKPGEIIEYEDVVITTKTMSLSSWKSMVVFSLTTMVFHSLKLGFFILMYLAQRFEIKYTDFLSFISENNISKKSTPFIKSELQNFYDHTDRILEGKGRGISLPEYGEISWDVEEASFLRISENLDTFYNELFDVIVCFLKEKNINFDREELKQALNYQKCRIPQPSARSEREVSFDQNFPLYFDTLLSDCPEPLAEHSQSILIKQKDFQNDKKLFAKEIILWGRKSGTNLTEVEFLPEASTV